MALSVELTSADLDEIRQSALGAADPLGLAAELAAAAGAGRLADPRDAGYAFTLAAEIAESRSRLDAALRYVEQALAADGDRDDNRTGAARALRARVLFRTGRADEATAEAETLRPHLTRYPDAAAYISAALAAGGRHQLAEQWLTEAVEESMAARSGEPSDADDAGLLFFLLQQRHRLRHALGRQHDAHDNLADRLETRLAGTARTAAGATTELVFFPRAEFDQVLTRWPALAGAYGKDWDEHRARLETELVRRGGVPLLTGSADGLAAQGETTPEEAPAAYARRLATGTPARISWPPERNGACWCGSGGKYKKCCLPRSRG